LFERVGTPEDLNKMRADLMKLGEWSREWMMMFNIDKCKVMHVGYGNGKAQYDMNGVGLQPCR
jgi:hypothetical protein